MENAKKRFRIVAGPTGSQTKCPVCEILLEAPTSQQVDRLLQQHLRKKHSKNEQQQAKTRMIRQPASEAV